MEFIQKHNFYRQLPNGAQKLVAKNVRMRVEICEEDIIGVQEVFNERTRQPYKNVCTLMLVNYAQYENQLTVCYNYNKMVKFLNDRPRTDKHITIKGFVR